MANPQNVGGGTSPDERTAVVPPPPPPQADPMAALRALLNDPDALAAVAAQSKRAARENKRLQEKAAREQAVLARQQAKAEQKQRKEAAKARETAYETEALKLLEKPLDDAGLASTADDWVLFRQTFLRVDEGFSRLKKAILLVVCSLLLIVLIVFVDLLVIQGFQGRSGQAVGNTTVAAKVVEGTPAPTPAPPAPAVTRPAVVMLEPLKLAPVTAPKEPFTANCSNEAPGSVARSGERNEIFHGKVCLPAGIKEGEIIAVRCGGKVRSLPAGTRWAKGFQADDCRIELP